MRTATFEGTRKVYYPDEVAFCFNPIKVIVETLVEVTVTVTSGRSFSDRRMPVGGKVEFDISAYVRALFQIDGKTLVLSMGVHVEVESVAGKFEFDTDCIWGAMNIGEVFNASRTVVWFRKYPSTISLYVGNDVDVSVRRDDSYYSPLNIGKGLLHLAPEDIFPNIDRNGYLHLEGEAVSSTFDYTFDTSFRPVSEDTVNIRIVADDSECGVYLRWIDRHGFYQYWLFIQGDDIIQASELDSRIHEEYSDGKYAYSGVNRCQGKETQRSLKVGASMVDRETFRMLATLLSSPLVDMYESGEWIPVNISSGTATDTGASLQDFETEIILPDIISQVL